MTLMLIQLSMAHIATAAHPSIKNNRAVMSQFHLWKMAWDEVTSRFDDYVEQVKEEKQLPLGVDMGSSMH